MVEALVVLLLSLVSVCFITKWVLGSNPPWRRRSSKQLPPSPRKLPIWGNLHQIGDLAHRSLHSLGAKHGPIMLIHFGSTPAIIVQSADTAKEILKTHDLLFADRSHTKTTKRLCYNLKDMSVAPYGEYWRNLRSITTLKLLSAKRVQFCHVIRQEETLLLMKRIKSCFLSGSPRPFDLSESFMKLSNDVICRSVFGEKCSDGEEGKKFLKVLRRVLELFGCMTIGEHIPWLWWVSYVNGFDRMLETTAVEIDGFLDAFLDEHMDKYDHEQGGGGGGDDRSMESFIDILVDIYKDNRTDGVFIDRDGIKALVLDLLDAGSDTTSANIEWAMAELLRHPEVLKRLQNEVREIATRDDDNMTIITETDLKKMHYLKAVVKETLRLHPPIAIAGRSARDNVKVMGYDIPRGTMVITNNWAIGRDPEYWDEPDEFRPERFLNSTVDYFKGVDFKYIPFGAGRRGCPGITFAMAVVELVLANLMQKFDWELPDGAKPEDLDMTEQPGTAVHRKNPLLVVATHCYF
ncbi:hypothetical protein ABFS83_14G286500 [Erythranthe nasuta]